MESYEMKKILVILDLFGGEWKLNVVVGGTSNKKVWEALLYNLIDFLVSYISKWSC